MKMKFYKNLKIALLAVAMTVFSGLVYSQSTYTFNYTGASQTLAVSAGTYSLQCWGANGGTSAGGKGGYSTGSITVTSPSTLYIYVGGAGTATNVTGSSNAAGGWNGGGNGSCYSSYGTSGGGGGGSDIRTTQNTTYLNRIIVAGGGGGGSVPGSYGYTGGNGGGSSGSNGAAYGSYWIGQGGTQSAGGGGTTESNSTVGSGSLGIGGSHTSTAPGSGWAGCGGGGGYYGGSAGGAVHSSGGGGSGYVGGVSSGSTFVSGASGFVTNPVTTGNGLVIIKELCNINLTAIGLTTGSYVCSGNSVTLTTNATSNYSWSTGATTQSIVVSPTSNGTYSVSGTSTAGCNATATTSISVNGAVPSLTVVNSASTNSFGVCPGSTVNLAASGANTYTWSTSTVTNGVSFAPTASSGYTVQGQNGCGITTAVTSVSLHPTPTVGATALTGSICSGNTTTIVVTGNSVSHTITTAVSAPQVTNNVGFQPAVTNTYNVTGANALGCTVTANASVQVVQTPTLAPTSSTLLICMGKSATLTATGATGGYTWTSGTSTLATTSTLAITPTITTTYSITKNSATCFDTKPITITVNALTPVFAAANQTLVCAAKPTTLSAFGGIGYAWYSSAAPTVSFSASSNPVVSPSVNTTYTVAASDGTCINTAVVSVSTNPNPTINIVTSGTTVCIGSVVTLTASGGNNYTWTSVPATPTVTGTDNIAPTFTAPGAYAFNATGDNQYNCTSSNLSVIIVNAPPALNVTATKSVICSGGATTLNVQGANSFQWDSNANSATTQSTVVNPTVTTVYNVSGTLSATGCSSSSNVVVYIYSPTVSILSPTNVCLGTSITLTTQVNNPSSGSVNSYTWSGPGIPANSFGQNLVVTPTILTVYTVSAKSTTMGNLVCVQQKTTSIGIYINPTITVVPTRTYVCKNEPVDLVASGGDTYTWNNNSFAGGTITVTNPNVGTVAYTVVGTDANGCKGSFVYYLKINGCQGLEEFNQNAQNIQIYPNPNTGSFYLVGESSMSLQLVNELGQVVKQIQLGSFNSNKVEVTDLTKGIYFITGSNGQAVIRHKVIVE